MTWTLCSSCFVQHSDSYSVLRKGDGGIILRYPLSRWHWCNTCRSHPHDGRNPSQAAHGKFLPEMEQCVKYLALLSDLFLESPSRWKRSSRIQWSSSSWSSPRIPPLVGTRIGWQMSDGTLKLKVFWEELSVGELDLWKLNEQCRINNAVWDRCRRVSYKWMGLGMDISEWGLCC